MIISDDLWNDYLSKVISVGLSTIENTKIYYDIVNNRQLAELIRDNNAGTPHFNMLVEVLGNQELSKCPNCGHYNENIECAIVVCEYCSNEFNIETESALEVCKDCVAFKTSNCNRKPTNKKNI